ncbi:hypothetical protein [Motiliproteus sediminis]|uniref:hypothetical protein n=1 Tax=Motiliproteus sediminis TaxID=1468178 RepID=UPI001AF01CA0|nr:hypothetical protein [Motiliproteus sediminis]
MHRNDLAALPQPRYLLYPNPWLHRGLMVLPLVALGGYLSWFIPLLSSGQDLFGHWILLGFLGLMNVGLVRSRGRDWRHGISCAATTAGVWFVTDADGRCEFIPWPQIGQVYASSINGRSGAIKGVVFELQVDSASWQRLHGNPCAIRAPRSATGNYQLGLAANLRQPGSIVTELIRLRALCPLPQPSLTA